MSFILHPGHYQQWGKWVSAKFCPGREFRPHCSGYLMKSWMCKRCMTRAPTPENSRYQKFGVVWFVAQLRWRDPRSLLLTGETGETSSIAVSHNQVSLSESKGSGFALYRKVGGKKPNQPKQKKPPTQHRKHQLPYIHYWHPGCSGGM